MTTNLATYSNTGYRPGGALKRTAWHFTNMLFFKTMLPFPSRCKTFLLRAFGATVGNGVVIKPNVKIKHPWFLRPINVIASAAKQSMLPVPSACNAALLQCGTTIYFENGGVSI